MEDLLSAVKSSKPCLSCALKAKEEEFEELKIIPNGFTQYGINYHLHDFIYIRPPDNNSGVLEIAQILKIKGEPPELQLSVQSFGRCNDYISEMDAEGSSTMVSDEVREM